jgi:hypothetical protein
MSVAATPAEALRVVSYDPPGHAVGGSCGEFTRHYYLAALETDADRADFAAWTAAFRVE